MTQCPAPGTSDPRWYQRLFEANPVPMWIYDLQTLGFLDVNEVACQKYGYSREEFLAMTIRDIRPPEDIAAFARKRLGKLFCYVSDPLPLIVNGHDYFELYCLSNNRYAISLIKRGVDHVIRKYTPASRRRSVHQEGVR